MATLKLTAREKRFVDEYLIDLNGAAAMRRTGFKGKRPDVAASKMLKRTAVREMVDLRMIERAKRTQIDQDYVLKTIQETIERCRAGILDPANVLRGCELLGKHLKMWTEKHELAGANGGPVVVAATVTDPIEAARVYKQLMESPT